MEDILKKLIYTGVGFFSLTASKVKEAVDKLIHDRKITEEEGKKLVDDFLAKTKEQRKEFEEQLRAASSKFSKESETSSEETISTLKKRIQELESQLEGSGTEKTNPHATAGSATSDRSGRISMEENTLQQEKRQAAGQQEQAQETEGTQNTINKVKNDERVSFSDDVLTPEKKMEAEKQRQQEQQNRPSAGRKEEDTQKANLGGPVLTPDKKMDQARQQSNED